MAGFIDKRVSLSLSLSRFAVRNGVRPQCAANSHKAGQTSGVRPHPAISPSVCIQRGIITNIFQSELVFFIIPVPSFYRVFSMKSARIIALYTLQRRIFRSFSIFFREKLHRDRSVRVFFLVAERKMASRVKGAFPLAANSFICLRWKGGEAEIRRVGERIPPPGYLDRRRRKTRPPFSTSFFPSRSLFSSSSSSSWSWSLSRRGEFFCARAFFFFSVFVEENALLLPAPAWLLSSWVPDKMANAEIRGQPTTIQKLFQSLKRLILSSLLLLE